MKYFKYLVLTFIIATPSIVFGQLTQSDVEILYKDRPDEEVIAYYDLRNRKTYIQVTSVESENSAVLPTVCLHIQIFQQDKGCVELNFEDELTPNDTVIYDMDNIVRNNGTAVPVNLDEDSYGYVTVSAYECGNTSNDGLSDPLIGNFRIVDDAGYEYRVNMLVERQDVDIVEELPNEGLDATTAQRANVIIPFNTVDGATHADIVGFVIEEDRNLAGVDDGTVADLVYNEKVGVTFDIFQIDENEERISCGQKTFGCGPDVVMNYGVNDDFPASRGDNVLCDGAGLLPNQTNGYISLENAFMLSPLDAVDPPVDTGFEFACLVGLNNNNGTGSMDVCQVKCNFPPGPAQVEDGVNQSDCGISFDP